MQQESPMPRPSRPSTERTQKLLERLCTQGLKDRSGEWFRQEMFPQDIATRNENEPIIVRRALAFQAMLRAMADEKNSQSTGSFDIRPGELIVGVLPMGSVGLGKEFPRYLLEDERRLAMMTSRDEESIFGHNCPDHAKVLARGLEHVAHVSNVAVSVLEADAHNSLVRKKIAFHRAVIICCEAVMEYAARFASLAEKHARAASDPKRSEELTRIAAICRQVPAKPARDFHEAVQSVWLVHLALHATLDLVSPGRLDQVLQPYLQASLDAKALTRPQALELLECFLIKGAERLNFTNAFLARQDHLDFGTGLGTSPVFLDQVASANNFMQNIVLGGVDREGRDAWNECTELFLEASRNVGLPTPVVVLRVHKGTSEKMLRSAAETLLGGSHGLPTLYNDEVIVDGLRQSGVPLEEARDYVVDGCWEPILNARCDWTFGMVNLLSVLECALNSGCLLTSDPSFLRGQKRSFATPPPEKLTSFQALQEALAKQIGLHVDKVGLSIFDFYSIDGSVTPTPFLSALIHGCQERGMDKTWGGADFVLGGIIAVAAPNCANALVAIKRLVYESKKVSLVELMEALRSDFANAPGLRADLLGEPKFGNGEEEPDEMMRWLTAVFEEAVGRTKALADRVFRDEPRCEDAARIGEWRSLAGYEGPAMRSRFGPHFDILLTSGMGTFGQYVSMGKGVAASADGRRRNAPVAPNCSPASGTARRGLTHMLQSMGALPLDRFGAGVVLDVCLPPCDTGALVRILEDRHEHRWNILTLSIATAGVLRRAHEACLEVESAATEQERLAAVNALAPFAALSVRVGGWNAPFITLSREQREDYLARQTA